MSHDVIKLIQRYFDAFNHNDMPTFFSLLDKNIVHDINQGPRQIGKEAFKEFMAHMNECYQEKISQLVIMANAEGTRAAAEFVVDGVYLATDPGFPPATKQFYSLPAGAFFTLAAGKITRVTTYYNVKQWINLVS